MEKFLYETPKKDLEKARQDIEKRILKKYNITKKEMVELQKKSARLSKLVSELGELEPKLNRQEIRKNVNERLGGEDKETNLVRIQSEEEELKEKIALINNEIRELIEIFNNLGGMAAYQEIEGYLYKDVAKEFEKYSGK